MCSALLPSLGVLGPGTCALGREGYACGRCQPLHFSGGGEPSECGACDEGTGAGAGPALLALLLVILALLLYVMCFFFSADPKAQGLTPISSGVILGMAVSLIQVLQVFDTLSINWGHPFDKVLAALSEACPQDEEALEKVPGQS